MYRPDDYMVKPVKVLVTIGMVLLALAAIEALVENLDSSAGFNAGGFYLFVGLLGFFPFIIGCCLITQTNKIKRREVITFILRCMFVLILIMFVCRLLLNSNLRSMRFIPWLIWFALLFVFAIVFTIPGARKRWKVLLAPMILLFVLSTSAGVYQTTQVELFYDQLENRYGAQLRDWNRLGQYVADPPAVVESVIYNADSGNFVWDWNHPASPDEVTVIIIRTSKEVTRYSGSWWYTDGNGNLTSPVDSARTGIDTSVETTDRFLDVTTLNIYNVKSH